MDPQGPGAARIANLSWILIGAGTAVYVVVMGILVVGLLRRRKMRGEEQRDSEAQAAADSRMANRIVIGGIVATVLILIIVFSFSVGTQIALSTPQRASGEAGNGQASGGRAADELVIEVIGRQWWWEVHYPESEVVTANEILIPAGVPVTFQLSSADVIHSFWVPELHGKLDMIPGQTNTFWVQADAPGEYWGLCAEFCGTQHANMLFLVVAVPPEEFDPWLQLQQQDAPAPEEPLAQEGQEVFMNTSCIYCHAIAGTEATSDLGPDLTHFASRRTIGAGTLPNNRGNLAGWIVDPQHIKEKSLMPAAPALTSAQLHALLAYLETLE